MVTEIKGYVPSRTEGRSWENCTILMSMIHLPVFSEEHPQEVVYPVEESWYPKQVQERNFSATAALAVLQGVSGPEGWQSGYVLGQASRDLLAVLKAM